MRISITSSEKVTDGMRECIEKYLTRLDKYFSDCETTVRVVSDNGLKIKTYLHTNLGDFRAEISGKDMYEMMPALEDKLDKVVRRHKDKLIASKKRTREATTEAVEREHIEEKIKTKIVELKPIFVEDAIREMDMLGYEHYMYRDAETQKVAVIHKRQNGGYVVTVEA